MKIPCHPKLADFFIWLEFVLKNLPFKNKLCFFFQAQIHQNQPYDESLEVGDAEEIASIYSPTPRVTQQGIIVSEYILNF